MGIDRNSSPRNDSTPEHFRERLDVILQDPSAPLERLNLEDYRNLTRLALDLIDSDPSKSDEDKLVALNEMSPKDRLVLQEKYKPALEKLKELIAETQIATTSSWVERIHPPNSDLEHKGDITRTLLRNAINKDHFARFRKGRLGCLEGNVDNDYGDLRWHSIALTFAHKNGLNTEWVLNVLLAIQLNQMGMMNKAKKPKSLEASALESYVDHTKSAVANTAPCSIIDVKADLMHVSADEEGNVVITFEANGDRPVLTVRTNIRNSALSLTIIDLKQSSA